MCFALLYIISLIEKKKTQKIVYELQYISITVYTVATC